MPKEIDLTEDTVRLGDGWGIAAGGESPSVRDLYSKSLSVPVQDRPRKIIFSRADVPPEGYELEICKERIEVRASDDRGYVNALRTMKQLANGDELPTGRVRDRPSLSLRGFHVNFDSYVQMKADDAKNLIKAAANMKLNAILLEYGPRFPFRKHSAIRSPSALTVEEVREVVGFAAENHVEVIPLQQSIGHLRYLLAHDDYEDIREPPSDYYTVEGKPYALDQVCPMNPRSFEVITDLMAEVIELHPGSKFFHIGADEARQLGMCAKCRAEEAKKGKAGVYLNLVNRVCEWLHERGRTPILWDDILCAHPEALKDLNRNAWLMYWDYWTVSDPSPRVVARGTRSAGYDRRWLGEWLDELPARWLPSILEGARRAGGRSFEEELGPKYLSYFKRYLGGGFPKYLRAFPYIEFYQDNGFQVIAAPTAIGDGELWHGLPNFARFVPNIRAFARRCIENGKVPGLITTAWYNYPPEILYLGLVATAKFTWE
ncbi:MAG: family 20 glycosylhydrolase [Candidatus Brockarchaeota archaeon]|nr:family 20 glycosylhydrolase [Candidatus Brockarchaeota archaeon]